MTKISIYNVDNNVAGNDRWIGSDAQNFNATKNFTPNGLASYFNHNQVIDSGNALRYTYQTLDPLEARRYGTISFITEIGPQVNFSSITTFLLSKYTLKYNIVSEYLQFLNGSKVVISKASDTNIFGLYKITNVNVYLPEPNFFNVDLTFIDGNGFIYEDEDYIISLVLDKYDQPITRTSELINDGEDGIHPFITAQDLPAQITLTTTGTSGVATLIGNVLNIPDYSVGSTPNLQNVTDQGNTTTNTIILDNGSGDAVGISPLEIQISSLNSDGGFSTLNGVYLINNVTTEQFKLDYDGLFLKTTSGGNGGIIKSDLLTSTLKTYQLPNASGTIALTSNIPTVTPSALTKTDDTNVTLTLGGTPATALLQGVSLTLGWTGTLADSRIASASTWNAKQNALSGTGIVKSTAGTISYVNGTTSEYVRGDGSLATFPTIPTVGTWGALNYPTWTSGTPFVKMTAAGTFALDTNTYLTSAVTSVSASGLLTSTGGNTPTISTQIHTNVLVGRTTAGTGIMEEITVGSGLTLSAGTLSATSTGGGIQHATASGTDTYTATVTGVTSYADGDAYLIRFTNGNTTSCTLNINGLGAVPLYENNDGAIIGGGIWAGAEMLCVYNSGANTFQCIGTSSNSLFSYVTNADTVPITKGMPVYAAGGQGDRLTVKRAFNTSDLTSAQTVGVVLTSSIGVNQKGIIIVQGLLDGLSILPTATWADGDPVYLDSTAGNITKVKPYAPNHLVYLGTVTTASNGSAGRWYVRVQNGYELDELHNVQAQSPSVNDILYYFGGSPGQWKTASIPTVLGYTPFQLPSLSSGSVLFSNGTTIAQDSANFFWDDTNNRLGIGTGTPYTSLTISDSATTQIVLRSTTGKEGISSFSGGNLASFDITAPSPIYEYGPLTMIPSTSFITFAGFEVLSGNITTGYIPRKAAVGVVDSNIYDDGTNIGVGTATPTTELDVNGVITATGGNSTSWNAKQDAITLTTTGSSGPATLVGTTLNIPEYGGGGGSTPVKLTSQTLIAASWSLSGGYYTYTFSNVNIDTTCDVSVTPQNSSYLTAYNAQVLPFVGVAAGVATFYSQFPPQANIVVDIVITQTT